MLLADELKDFIHIENLGTLLRLQNVVSARYLMAPYTLSITMTVNTKWPFSVDELLLTWIS